MPFIPQMDPQLSPAVYELVLNTFLQKDSKVMCHVEPIALYPLFSVDRAPLSAIYIITSNLKKRHIEGKIRMGYMSHG